MTKLEKIEGDLQLIWLRLRAAQDAELLGQDGKVIPTARYWQGLPTHDAVPETETAPNTKRANGRKTWAEMVPVFPAKLEVMLECQEYEGPLGRGFVLVATAQDNGVLYSYRLHHGPESHRDGGAGVWVALVPETDFAKGGP